MLVDKGSVLCDMADYNLFDKLGGNIQKKKLEKALEMLRDEDPRELRKRLGNIDTQEILEKIDEFDMDKLSQMGISMDEIRSRVTERDFEKLINVLGPDGVIIAQRLRSLLR
jgi:hypothetical protein